MGSSHVTWSLSYDEVMDERLVSMAEIWRRQRENRKHNSGDIKRETEQHSSGDVKGKTESTVVVTPR
jgi:hypothetical protein